MNGLTIRNEPQVRRNSCDGRKPRSSAKGHRERFESGSTPINRAVNKILTGRTNRQAEICPAGEDFQHYQEDAGNDNCPERGKSELQTKCPYRFRNPRSEEN